MTGQHLIDLGYKPGKWFKEALDHINKYNLQGTDLVQYLDNMKPYEIEPYDLPVHYTVNLQASSPDEIQNYRQVIANMDKVMNAPTVIAGAIMPDACPTGEGQIPVGGIVATKNAIHPAMHSADICCSLFYTNLGKVDPKSVLDCAVKVTHFGTGGRTLFSELPSNLEKEFKQNVFLKNAIEVAKWHLGTQGDGNHFLYVGIDEEDNTILVTHHGSRGLGAYLYKEGMREAEKIRKQISPKSSNKNPWIPYDQQIGQDYWEALQLVRSWTKLNHEVLHNAITGKIKARVNSQFWNEHNFVFKHEDVFYHAKGATPLRDDFVPDNNSGLRIIPLNMAQPILLVKSIKQASSHNLGFAPHGAGRNLSRTQHAKKLIDMYGNNIEEIVKSETAHLDIRFFNGIADLSELPSAYKNAEEVQNQIGHFKLGEIDSKIFPYGCIMAGKINFTRRVKK